MSVIISIVIGYLLDMLIGTPKFLMKIKSVITALIHRIYSSVNKRFSVIFTLVIVIAIALGIYFLLDFLKGYNMIIAIIVESIISFLCISCREIRDKGERVYRPLKRGYVKSASKIYETVSEKEEEEPYKIAENMLVMTLNSSLENVMTPVVFIMLFGGAGGIFYKLISFIAEGSHQRFASGLKNICEFIPARIQILFMNISSGLLRLDKKMGKRIYKRDKYKINSINKGLALSYCAGALNTELYLGKVEPLIGKTSRSKIASAGDIKRICDLINISSLMALVFFVVIRLIAVIFIL